MCGLDKMLNLTWTWLQQRIPTRSKNSSTQLLVNKYSLVSRIPIYYVLQYSTEIHF